MAAPRFARALPAAKVLKRKRPPLHRCHRSLRSTLGHGQRSPKKLLRAVVAGCPVSGPRHARLMHVRLNPG
jgi:hypothetical protein